MPANPEMAIKAGDLQYSHAVDAGDYLHMYSAMRAQLSREEIKNVNAEIDKVIKDGTSDGTLISYKKIIVQGYPGLDFMYKDEPDKTVIRMKVVFAGKYGYVLVSSKEPVQQATSFGDITKSVAELSTPQMNAFFNSLSITQPVKK